MSNKPIHYLLDYGDLKRSAQVLQCSILHIEFSFEQLWLCIVLKIYCGLLYTSHIALTRRLSSIKTEIRCYWLWNRIWSVFKLRMHEERYMWPCITYLVGLYNHFTTLKLCLLILYTTLITNWTFQMCFIQRSRDRLLSNVIFHT